jgi:hypothetical protein
MAAAAAAELASVLLLALRMVVHFSTMMMHTAWLRLDTSFILVAPVARCSSPRYRAEAAVQQS